MADNVERLAVLIEANTRSYENAMKKLQASTTKAINASSSQFGTLDKRMQGLFATTRSLAGAFGVTLAIGGIGRMVKSSVEAGAKIGDLSDNLGISAERFQELAFSASQAGASEEAMVAGFRAMTRIIGEAERGSKAAIAEFTALGISFDQVREKSPADAFVFLLDKIGKLSTPLERNAALMKIFGKSGTDLASMAKAGGEALDGFAAKARKIGIVISNQTIKKLQDAADTFDVLSGVSRAAGASLAEAFLPAISALAKQMSSERFQTGLKQTASGLGEIVRILAENPDLVRFLGGAAIGARIGGLPGAAIGGLGTELFFGGGSLSPNDQPFKSDAEAQKFFAFEQRLKSAFGDSATGSLSSGVIASSDSFKKFQESLAGATETTDLATGSTVALGGAHQDLVDDVEASSDAAAAAMERLEAVTAEVAATAQQFASTFLHGMIEGESATKSLGEALKQLADQLLENSLNLLFSTLFKSLAGGFGGVSTSVGMYHAGGVVGAGGGRARSVSPALFAGAPRLHGGLMPDEFPAILQKGEIVIPRGASARAAPAGRESGGATIVNVHQNIDARGADSSAVDRMKVALAANNRQLEERLPDILRRHKANRRI